MAYFGWQGLLLEHPDDWAPVALTGDRRSGYARLASPRSSSLQIRWAPSGSEALERALERYLHRLARDARRKRAPFESHCRSNARGYRYRYRGEVDGEGLLFPADDGRVVFLEAIGDSSTARTRTIERARDSFAADGERWAVLGLDVRLPAPLKVDGKEFLAGRTTLRLAGRGVRIVAERWGLAQSLLAQATLLEWATNRLGNGWGLKVEVQGLIGRKRNAFGDEEAIVVHQAGVNQIVLVRSRSRAEEWKPKWDWLN